MHITHSVQIKQVFLATSALVVLGSVTACGASSPQAEQSPATRTSSSSTVSATESPAAMPTTSSAPSSSPVASSQTARQEAMVDVQLPEHKLPTGESLATVLSPSTNIACELYEAFAQCSVRSLGEEMLKKSPPAPGSVAIHGWSYAVDKSGKVYDTGANQAPLATLDDYRGTVLPYGAQAQVGQFLLTSHESGMTLTDTASGHGATYNRDGITTF